MAISSVALSAYRAALSQGSAIDAKVASSLAKPQAPSESFTKTLSESLKQVNDMQNSKNDMVEAFASGKSENVHELMINLQKAGLTMQMTTTVRNKVLDAYRELVKLQF